MQFQVGFKTDVGRKRKQNQDNAASVPELGLFVVADGMGGHQGGEIASAIVVDTLPRVIEKARAQSENWKPKAALTQSILLANEAIYKKGQENASLQGMGTTTVALLFEENTLNIGHVGDSRCYFIRPHSLWQVTRDHSLVQEKLRAGLITRQQLKTDRMKNVITRSVGYESMVEVDTYEMKIQSGDLFLICSDGLSGLLEDVEIMKIVQNLFFDEGKSLQQTVEALIQTANDKGGDDNITAILIQV